MPNIRPVHRILVSAAIAAGVSIGLATNAHAAPVSDDFWECVADHQDTDGIGVCCIFYGGDYDERTGECWIDHEAKLEEANPGPGVPPKRAVLTQLPNMPVASLA